MTPDVVQVTVGPAGPEIIRLATEVGAVAIVMGTRGRSGIKRALLGSVDLIPEPEEMAAEFESMMRASMARGVASAELRVWAPQGAELLFVRQVSPTLEDLTARRTPVNPLTGAYPTGAWSDESRDYHVAVRLPARTLGQEQLAARVPLSLGAEPVAQGLVKAKWSNDDALTTRIDPAVAAEITSMVVAGKSTSSSRNILSNRGTTRNSTSPSVTKITVCTPQPQMPHNRARLSLSRGAAVLICLRFAIFLLAI